MYDKLVKRLRDWSKICTQYEGSIDQLHNEAADAIEALSKPRWIPVTERLPEENELCIVFNKYYGPMIGWRVDGERFRIPGYRFPDNPTHWMPLPEPPKEET